MYFHPVYGGRGCLMPSLSLRVCRQGWRDCIQLTALPGIPSIIHRIQTSTVLSLSIGKRERRVLWLIFYFSYSYVLKESLDLAGSHSAVVFICA